MNPTLHVVTHRAWVAYDLKDGAERLATLPESHPLGGVKVNVEHHLGFDLPPLSPGDAIWAPMETMARVAAQDPRLRLADPGPEFLTDLPWRLTGRTVELLDTEDMDALVPGDIRDDGDVVFAKPANCKIEDFPACWDDYDGHILRAIAARCPAEQKFLVTDTVLDLVAEVRLFVLDEQVVTFSPYLLHAPDGTQRTWDETMPWTHTAAAVEFGASVLDWLREVDRPMPRSYTLDVGVLADGTWVVIETNPVWSSAFYGANTSAVITCLFAAVTVTPGSDLTSGRYSPPAPSEWTPDPYLAARVAQQRPLPTTRPTDRATRSTP